MIRKATPDDAEQVVPLMLQAMGDLAVKFAGSKDQDTITHLFRYFFSLTGNQYSYENTLVYVTDEIVLGSINAYDGALLDLLRKPFLAYLETRGHCNMLRDERETEEGEFYIDTVSVLASAQGRGIGKLLIHAALKWGKELNHHQAGLLVEKTNPNALKLYQRIGFHVKNERKFLGGTYDHMVFNIDHKIVG